MKIAIFVHQPACSVDSANGIISALSSHHSFKLFSRDQVESTFFRDVDCVCFPGGIGDADRFDYLMPYNLELVKDYVNNGGRYLGICMGAYWAGSYYFNILDGIDTVQYIKQPNADTRRPHAKSLKVIWEDQPCKMFFYDGCAIVGDLSKTKVVATYTNGDAMAVIQNNIGLIGCHPESEPYWYNNYSWMKTNYVDNKKLLCQFVNDLTHCN